jgi:hypothetical protein
MLLIIEIIVNYTKIIFVHFRIGIGRCFLLENTDAHFEAAVSVWAA